MSEIAADLGESSDRDHYRVREIRQNRSTTFELIESCHAHSVTPIS